MKMLILEICCISKVENLKKLSNVRNGVEILFSQSIFYIMLACKLMVISYYYHNNSDPIQISSVNCL